MTIVIEIASRTGTRGYKEYDAPSLDAALNAARTELRNYPAFRIIDAWVKGCRELERESADAW